MQDRATAAKRSIPARPPAPERTVGNIRIGLAGWDYADWKGVVYPAGTSRAFDRLAYVSTLVDAVEINSSFYRPVAPRVAESWLRRTERRTEFRFTAKSHRSWTHEPGADHAVVVQPPAQRRQGISRVS